MGSSNESRRAFLAAATAGAGAAFAPDANAQGRDRHAAHGDSASDIVHTKGDERGAFFNDEDAATIGAFTERLMPGAPGKPGAHDAGVLNYIDLALAGAYGDLQEFYRHGLAQLEAYCRKLYKLPFTRLDAARQDEVITTLAEGTATDFTWPTAQTFFNVVRTHTMEGMFADPLYGGNKDFAGWRLVGFPGAQMTFTDSDLRSEQAFAGAPIIGLQMQTKTPIRRP